MVKTEPIQDVSYDRVRNEDLFYKKYDLMAFKASTGRPVQFQSDCDLIATKHVILDYFKTQEDITAKGTLPLTFRGECKLQGAADMTCGTTPCSRSEITCSADFECQKFVGVGLCREGYCYLDATAMQQARSQVSFLGIKASPNLQKQYKPIISIPNLNFSNLDTQVDQEGYLNIPWIGEYIAAMYKFGVVVASIVGSVMLIVQGARIIMSRGGEDKAEAYKRIFQVGTGLIILWTSYALLYAINPDLVNLKSLRVKFVEREDLKVDDHTCDDISECPELQKAPPVVTKGTCQSDLTLANKDRAAPINFSLFANVDHRTYGKRELKGIAKIVIHNGGYTAKMNNDTWQKRAAAAHYTIQRDGTIFQHAGEECVVPHAPGGNKDGIGIEINIDKSGKTSCNSLKSSSKPEEIKTACTPTAAQYSSLNRLIEDIINRTSVKKNNAQIVGHCELVGKDGHGDPRAFDWTQIGLSNEVKKKLAQGHACSWYLPF